MLTFDLHYHTNVYRLPRSLRERRLRRINRTLAENNVDYMASTEHAYKAPFEAWLYLSEAATGLNTNVIPGMEAITQEGIDIILLYRDEDMFRDSVKALPPFSRSLSWLLDHARDIGAIVIVPHPFTPGKTGAANELSALAYAHLLERVDYIEVHNGLSVVLRKLMHKPGFRKRNNFEELRRKIEYTWNLPKAYRGEGLGWTISSDAHFPDEQTYIGYTDRFYTDTQASDTLPPLPVIFDFLKRERIRFSMLNVKSEHKKEKVTKNLLRSGQCVVSEYWLKQQHTWNKKTRHYANLS